ncbi:hypothetical protein Kisp02_14180 [Kineosporia sp. NBRC 101731]|nr:hypothetical protein Kisp02_14180 [Kineosporia sp. NBRC 101731]
MGLAVGAGAAAGTGTPGTAPDTAPDTAPGGVPSVTPQATSAQDTNATPAGTKAGKGLSRRRAKTVENGGTASGSSSTVPERARGSLVLRVMAALVALAGVALLVVGTMKATVWAPSDTVTATLGAHSQKFVTSEIGSLALGGPRLEITVSGAGSNPVFVGIGRAGDVDAYLADAANDRITGLDQDTSTLITRVEGSETGEIPDPAAVDVWSVSSLGQGTASVTWPDPASGQWRLVIATDGTEVAPQNVTLTWTGAQISNPAPTYIATGVALLVVGVVISVMLRLRDRRRA